MSDNASVVVTIMGVVAFLILATLLGTRMGHEQDYRMAKLGFCYKSPASGESPTWLPCDAKAVLPAVEK